MGADRQRRDRHPHLYGEADEAPDWEELKAELKAASATDPASAADPFDGVPTGLEPLSRSLRLQDRAAARNFDWPDVTGALGKLHEEIGELERELSLLSAAGTADAALEDRLEDDLRGHLHHAIPDRRDPERTLPPVWFRDVPPAHRTRSVLPRTEDVMDLPEEVRNAPLLDHLQGLPVDAGSSHAGPHRLTSEAFQGKRVKLLQQSLSATGKIEDVILHGSDGKIEITA